MVHSLRPSQSERYSMSKRPASVRKDFLVFGQPDIGDAEIAEVTDSLRRNWLGTGPKVAQFERDFAAYKGVPAAVAVNSCTAGLHLALLAAGVGPGDEVITTPLTFCATANVIVHAGATPTWTRSWRSPTTASSRSSRIAPTRSRPSTRAGRPARSAISPRSRSTP